MHLMAERRRKTLITCRCHEDIQAGRATKP
jgi:hypothetical protein